MTDTKTEGLLPVEPVDREAAAKVRPYSHNSALILDGERDATDIVQAAAHARLLATRTPKETEAWRPIERYQHVKRGTFYDVIGVAELQCATGLNPGEGEELIIYHGDDGKLWARTADEFHDGRFARVAPPGTPHPAPVDAEAIREGVTALQLAEALNPDLFSRSEKTRHLAASPYDIGQAQGRAVAEARIALNRLSALRQPTPRGDDGGAEHG